MNLPSKAVAWHIGSIAAGAWGMAVFAQTNAVDLYAMIGQLKKVYGELTVLMTMAAPFIAAGVAAYRTAGLKQVPKDSVAIENSGGLDSPGHPPIGTVVGVTGKIVGALILAAILLAPMPSQAGPIADKIAADTAAKVAEVRAAIILDLTAARDDAKTEADPSEQCWQVLLNHAEKMPGKVMGIAHGVQRARTFRRNLPAIMDACAVVKEGARQAIISIFGTAIGGTTALAALGL